MLHSESLTLSPFFVRLGFSPQKHWDLYRVERRSGVGRVLVLTCSIYPARCACFSWGSLVGFSCEYRSRHPRCPACTMIDNASRCAIAPSHQKQNTRLLSAGGCGRGYLRGRLVPVLYLCVIFGLPILLQIAICPGMHTARQHGCT